MAAADSNHSPGLKRVLGLWDLVVMGIILIQPTAPMPLFGVTSQEARGHVVTAILLGMVAVMFTALSYGWMARMYPSAGSAYTYVGRELHPALGYLTGWGMLLEYVLGPVICTIWCAKAAGNFVPRIPYAGWAIFFALLFTALNLRGIKANARLNRWVAGGLGIVIVLFFLAATRYVLQQPHTAGEFLRPFYDPATFSFRAVGTGTSLGILTYIGFDAISTLSEEVHNPRRNILLATVLTCAITGVLAAFQCYAAQLVWPDYRTYPDADTAFVHIAGRAGGSGLFAAMNLALLVASIGSGAGAHLAAARTLYGMGRDNALPRRFFGAVDPVSGIPRNNVLLIGGILLAGAFTMSYQIGAELLNYGAFIAFMGVNLAAFARYWVRGERRTAWSFCAPLAGFAVCLAIFLSLRPPIIAIGTAWLASALLYGVWRNKGLRNLGATVPALPAEEAVH